MRVPTHGEPAAVRVTHLRVLVPLPGVLWGWCQFSSVGERERKELGQRNWSLGSRSHPYLWKSRVSHPVPDAGQREAARSALKNRVVARRLSWVASILRCTKELEHLLGFACSDPVTFDEHHLPIP